MKRMMVEGLLIAVAVVTLSTTFSTGVHADDSDCTWYEPMQMCIAQMCGFMDPTHECKKHSEHCDCVPVG